MKLPEHFWPESMDTPPVKAARDYAEAYALKALEQSHADNASLAAGQRIVPDGLLGDDRGRQYCRVTRELVNRRQQLSGMSEIADSATQAFSDRCQELAALRTAVTRLIDAEPAEFDDAFAGLEFLMKEPA